MSDPQKLHWPQYEVGAPIPGTECAVVQLLGAGGQAEVYLVRQTFIEKLAVMKLWKADAMTDASFRDFRGEAIRQGAMRHDNIVSVISGGMTGETPRRPYFMMEYHDGYTLQRALDATRRAERTARQAHLECLAEGRPSAYRPTWISVRNACELCIQLCDALTHAHVEHGVIHRDIKPANIFLVNRGFNSSVVKLFDFGIAKLVEDALKRPDAAFYGSLTHCAPEQLEGKASPQTDLYSMTLVLYELLTSARAFPDANTPAKYIRAALHETPLPPSERMRGISPALDRFVMRNLSKRPEQRSGSAREYAKELTAILDAYREEDLASDPGIHADGPTSRMPFQQILAMSAGMMDEQIARAKAASYWDSAKGVTVSVAAEAPEGDPAKAPAVHIAVRAELAKAGHAGPTGTTPMGNAEVTRAAREARDEERREEERRAAERGQAASLGDTSPSAGVVRPAQGPNRSGGPGPMSLASRRATTQPLAEPAPPPTDPMRSRSHAGHAAPVIREVSPTARARASATTPMAEAPGRVPAPGRRQQGSSGSLAGTAAPPSRFFVGTSRTSFAQAVIVGTGLLLVVSFVAVIASLRARGSSPPPATKVELPPSPLVTVTASSSVASVVDTAPPPTATELVPASPPMVAPSATGTSSRDAGTKVAKPTPPKPTSAGPRRMP